MPLNQIHEQTPHKALATQTLPPPDTIQFRSLEQKVAEFEFKDIVGHPVGQYLDNYVFIAYGFGKNVKARGKLSSRNEIIKFLDDNGYAVMKIYRCDKRLSPKDWTVKIERINGSMSVTYDALQWGEHGKNRFVFDSVTDNGAESVIKIWNTMLGYIDFQRAKN